VKNFSTTLSGLYSRQTFLIAGTLLFSVSPFLCALLYFGAASVSVFNWKQVIFTRERIVLTVCIVVLSIGLALRKVEPERILPGSISLSDYIPFLPFFFLISLKPFSESEITKFIYALMLTIPQQFLLAVGENYLSWYGRFYFWGEQFPLIDVYVGPIARGLKTSASFFNPNIFSVYCVLCAGICLNLLMAELKPLTLSYTINLKLGIRILVPFLGLALCTTLIIWSGSDAGLMTFLLSLIIGLSWMTDRWLYLISFGAASTLIAFISLNSFGWLTQVVTFLIPQRLLTLLNSALASWNDRKPFYKCAVQLIQEKPLQGWGIGQFSKECANRTGMEMAHAHNIFLQLGADTGLPLAILFLSFVGYILFSCIHFLRTVKTKKSMNYRLSAGLIIVAISIILMQLFDLGLLMSYRLNFLFWICLAIPYSLASQPKVSKAL
jgi:hypothetical protein